MTDSDMVNVLVKFLRNDMILDTASDNALYVSVIVLDIAVVLDTDSELVNVFVSVLVALYNLVILSLFANESVNILLMPDTLLRFSTNVLNDSDIVLERLICLDTDSELVKDLVNVLLAPNNLDVLSPLVNESDSVLSELNILSTLSVNVLNDSDIVLDNAVALDTLSDNT